MVNQALVDKRVSIASLLRELDRSPGHHGQRALRHILLTAEPTRSEAEDLLSQLLKSNDLASFRANRRIPGVGELDFLSANSNLALEFDSRLFHDNPIQRADDRVKRKRADARGIRVITVRWRDLTVDRHELAAKILS